MEEILCMRPEEDTRVAILVPTKDRSEFVGRLLKYYASVKSPHTLYIGDASQDFHLEQTKEAIARFSESLPALHSSTILPDVGHWIQQEAAEQVNELLIDFLDNAT